MSVVDKGCIDADGDAASSQNKFNESLFDKNESVYIARRRRSRCIDEEYNTDLHKIM